MPVDVVALAIVSSVAQYNDTGSEDKRGARSWSVTLKEQKGPTARIGRVWPGGHEGRAVGPCGRSHAEGGGETSKASDGRSRRSGEKALGHDGEGFYDDAELPVPSPLILLGSDHRFNGPIQPNLPSG